ncbi:MAG: hypothetical protein ACRD35_07925 [Candidatus Acidiferrales bacterium]
MPIFSRLFGSSQEREIKKLFHETHKRVEKEYKPLGEVGRAIIQASTNCCDSVKEIINAPTEKERLQQEIFIFYEFIYFYMHLTTRHAFVQLPEPQIRKLQGYLGPLISSVAIDSYFAHWPDDLKQKMTGEFYDKLNEAELEYTECTQFDSSGQGEQRLTPKLQALFTKLASNVANLCGHEEKDIGVIMPVAQVAINEWKKMALDNLMAEVQKVSYSPIRETGTPTPVPRWNLLVMAYPVSALIWAWAKSGSLFFAWLYGIGNLGYLLFALTVYPGHFRLMGLQNRKQVFAVGFIAWVSSVIFSYLAMK